MVKTLIYISILVLFVEICVRDKKQRVILNKSNVSLLFLGLILGVLENNLFERVLGAAAYTLPFILIYGYGSDILGMECIGVGDIKLMISLGTILKFENFYKVLLFINISFILPLFFLIVKYLLVKRIDREIAFGPFLIGACILTLILESYER